MDDFWKANRQQVIDDIWALMEEHPDSEWTMAAQAVAMMHGISEFEVFEEVRDYFEDYDPRDGATGTRYT